MCEELGILWYSPEIAKSLAQSYCPLLPALGLWQWDIFHLWSYLSVRHPVWSDEVSLPQKLCPGWAQSPLEGPISLQLLSDFRWPVLKKTPFREDINFTHFSPDTYLQVWVSELPLQVMDLVRTHVARGHWLATAVGRADEFPLCLLRFSSMFANCS